jgi:hypothetical protein
MSVWKSFTRIELIYAHLKWPLMRPFLFVPPPGKTRMETAVL